MNDGTKANHLDGQTVIVTASTGLPEHAGSFIAALQDDKLQPSGKEDFLLPILESGVWGSLDNVT